MTAEQISQALKIGISPAEVIKRAKALKKAAPYKMTTHAAVDFILDAAMEHAQ